jgi:hypothetical protein
VTNIKKRADRVKDSTDIIATIFLPNLYIARSIKLYVPSPRFVSNMRDSIQRKLLETRQIWKNEKQLFKKLWNTMDPELKKDFLIKLLDELDQNLEPYSESENLGRVLFSGFNIQNMTNALDEFNRFGLENILEWIETDKGFSKLMSLSEIKVTKTKNLSLGPSKEENNSEEVEIFIQTLQKLSYTVYSKHVLDRYYTHKMTKKGIQYYFDKFRVAIYLLIASIVIVFLLDYFGILRALFWGFS